MNLAPSDQILQYVAWGTALVEFILALYVLLLNAWHTANRHVSSLLLIVSLNSLALGLIQGARNVAQAVWPTYILATTTVYACGYSPCHRDAIAARLAAWPVATRLVAGRCDFTCSYLPT